MRPLLRVALAIVCVCLPAAHASAQDAKAVLAQATQAMGMANVRSITVGGTASYGNFGQSRGLSFGLASTTLRDYAWTLDFERGVARATGMAAPPGAPNGVPPGPFEELITPDSPGIKQLEMWTTPWGFLKGAAMGPITMKSTKVDAPGAAPNDTVYRAITWVPPFKSTSGRPYKIVGYIGPTNMVDKVETWIDHPLMGDLEVMVSYDKYADSKGLKVPVEVSRKYIGMEVFVARLVSATANPPDLAARLTASMPTAAPRVVPAPLASEKMADGVYRVTGGYDALVVGLKDGCVILGGGGDQARGLALLAEAKRLFPGRPVRYAVSMHGHFDHAMVLPAFASAGITILTDDQNRYFLEQSLLLPRTLVGDAFATSKKKAKFESVMDKVVLGDAGNRVELLHLKQIPHADGMLAAWLPASRILFVSDVELPAAGEAPSPSMVALMANVDRLGLDFEVLMTNGARSTAPISRAELLARLRPVPSQTGDAR